MYRDVPSGVPGDDVPMGQSPCVRGGFVAWVERACASMHPFAGAVDAWAMCTTSCMQVWLRCVVVPGRQGSS
jgi:hypothetical protein